MSKFLTIVLVLSISAGLIVLAFSSWRRRRREQAVGFSAPPENLEGETLASTAAQYVATTFRNEPLNRVTAHGLGFRGRAVVKVSVGGVVIERKGERNLAIASSRILGTTLEQATIDRVVEKGGLFAIHWRQDSTDLTTYLRFNSAAERDRLLQASPALARKTKS